MLEDTMTNTYTAKKEMALSSQDEKINSYLHLLLGLSLPLWSGDVSCDIFVRFCWMISCKICL